VIVSLLFIIAGLSHALLRYHPYAPHIEAVQRSPDSGSRTGEAKPPNDCADCQPRKQQADEEGSEFWPPVLGYRLKVTDTFVALFTAGLFVATWFLWLATKGLVKGADENAERQLRAYVYVEKTNLTFENEVWNHSFQMKNFGQTPAHNVSVISRSEVVDWNDGHPAIPNPTETDILGSMAPQGDFIESESTINGSATIAELNDQTKAIYLVGTITYSTVFGDAVCTTNFRYYAGGNMAYRGGEMYADSEGNDAT
jgi:hypothetical protein